MEAGVATELITGDEAAVGLIERVRVTTGLIEMLWNNYLLWLFQTTGI